MITDLRINSKRVSTRQAAFLGYSSPQPDKNSLFITAQQQDGIKFSADINFDLLPYLQASDSASQSQSQSKSESLSQSGSSSSASPPVQQNWLQTINTVKPSRHGDMYLLGDFCTSVTDGVSDYPDMEGPAIQIFDGCYPCTDCSDYWKLKQILNTLQMWNVGLKDCVLYYQPAAARLWSQMLQKRKIQGVKNCQAQQPLDQNYRSKQFGQAVKLLYQYKATVAMWNYLVFVKAHSTEVIHALQSGFGFIIQSKRIIDTCQVQGQGGLQGTIKLHMRAHLQSGQTPAMLSALGYRMLFYVTQVAQNTYIQSGTDTGRLDIVSRQGCSSQYSVNQSTIDMLVQFATSNQSRSTFSGAYKILPIICQSASLGGGTSDTDNPGQGFHKPQAAVVNGDQFTKPDQGGTSDSKDDQVIQLNPYGGISIAQYVDIRKNNTKMQLPDQVRTNRWRIQTYWEYTIGTRQATQELTKQVTFYTSSYLVYPESDSESD